MGNEEGSFTINWKYVRILSTNIYRNEGEKILGSALPLYTCSDQIEELKNPSVDSTLQFHVVKLSNSEEKIIYRIKKTFRYLVLCSTVWVRARQRVIYQNTYKRRGIQYYKFDYVIIYADMYNRGENVRQVTNKYLES